MTQEHCLGLPEHVAAKVEQVLGIPPSELSEHDLVGLIEELCDTALMFDREQHSGGQIQPETPSGETEGASAGQPQD